jgi:hypothetical protein
MNHVHVQCGVRATSLNADNAAKMEHSIKLYSKPPGLPQELSLGQGNPWKVVIPAVLHQLPSVLDLYKTVRLQGQRVDKGLEGPYLFHTRLL